jgi:hypothetical protein
MDMQTAVAWWPYLTATGALLIFPMTRRIVVYAVIAVLLLLAFSEPDLRD